MRKSASVSVLLFGFVCMGSFVVPGSASASESRLRRALRDAKKQARGLMCACSSLKTAAQKTCKQLSKAKNAPEKFKRIRTKICRVSSAMPNICSYTSTYGYRVINYANKLWNRCLQCLGSGKCHSRSQVSYCKSYISSFQSALQNLERYRLKMVYQANNYNKAIKALRRLLK